MNQYIPSEDEEQIVLVEYLEQRGFKFTAIPNHTYNPNFSQQRKNYKLGLRKGLCDMLIVLPGAGLLFIEMKRTKGSTTSPEQRSWVEALNALPGTAAHICKGAQEAIAVVESYAPLRYA